MNPTPTNSPPRQNARQWTNAQRLAIDLTDQSVLVSAAAGSGKTAVLAERCANLVCDSRPRCGIDQLLVVTFTESAATEMRWRIQQALRERLATIPVADRHYLLRQIALAEHAQVGTLHGFCARLLRQYFTDAGIDPTFRILDAEESRLLRARALDTLWARQFESGTDTPFTRLVDAYADSDADGLRPIVERIHDLRCSISDPAKWTRDAMANLAESASQPLAKSRIGRMMLDQITESLRRLGDQITATLRIAAVAGIAKYRDHLIQLGGIVSDRLGQVRAGNFDLLSEQFRQPLPRTPSVAADTPGKDLAKGLIDDIKNQLKEGPIWELLARPAEFWIEGMKATLGHAETLVQLADEFQREYDRVKSDQRALDFSDLERKALRLLSGPSRVAQACHQQFRHVLVDEYQDINDMQETILGLVSTECLADKSRPGNLFCVGDVKQSIFRFRQADSSLFLIRQKRFRTNEKAHRPGRSIDLGENFRSRGPLLEAINGFFERVMTEPAAEIEYDQTHRLIPAAVFRPDKPNGFSGHPIELHILAGDSDAAEATNASGDTDSADGGEGDSQTDSSSDESSTALERVEIEGRFVAHKIAELMGQAGGPRRVIADSSGAAGPTHRPIRYGDIVILLRTAYQKADRLADVLRKFGIPVQSDSSGGFLEAREVRDVLGLLSLIDNAAQDIPLAAYLRSPLVTLCNPEESLARIRVRYPRDAQAIPITFHEAARRYAREGGDELAACLRDVFDRLDDWRHQACVRPVAELVWDILDRTGYLAFCQGLQDGAQRAANLVGLHNLAVKFADLSRPGLSAFLEFVQKVRDESDFQRPSVAAEATGDGAVDAVRILTIHKSKGLEFPVVILPDLGKKFNTQDIRQPVLMDRKAGMGLQVVDLDRRIRFASLPWLLLRQRLSVSTAAEEMRLLYVAMTRAREHLILIGTASHKAADTWDSRWTAHSGPLPIEAIQNVRSMLDWIGPVASASGQDKIFHREIHSTADAARWVTGTQGPPDNASRLKSLAALEPLSPAPSPQSQAAAEPIIRRLQSVYPFTEATRRPAAMAVTTAVKPDKRHTVPETSCIPFLVPGPAGAQPISTMDRDLPLPAFVRGAAALSGADVGTATHLVMERLDVMRPCRGDDLEQQIAALVDQGHLAVEHAASVDRAGIEWFMDCPAGRVVRSAKLLMREAPFCLLPREMAWAQLPDVDNADRTVLRGTIDLLAIDQQDGVAIIDYKTDHVSGAELLDRVAIYRKQLQVYGEAVRRLAKRPVVACWLAFLSARELHEVGT